MARILYVFFICLVSLQAVSLAQEKVNDAAVSPIATLGEVSDSEKKILFNRLESDLNQFYKLVSAKEFEEAQEQAFEELDAEQCTEEQCIRIIQEILQVDRLFILQIIKEKVGSQISLTLTRADDKIVRTGVCRNCDIFQLADKIGALVGKVVKADIGNEIVKTRDKEEELRTTKDNREGNSWAVTLSILDNYSFQGGEQSTSATLGISYILTDFIISFEYGTGNTGGSPDFPNELLAFNSAEFTSLGGNLKWFPGTNSFYLIGGYISKNWNYTWNDLWDGHGTINYNLLKLGIGNQWILDSGLILEGSWLTFYQSLSSSHNPPDKPSTYNYVIVDDDYGQEEAYMEEFIDDHSVGFMWAPYFTIGYAF